MSPPAAPPPSASNALNALDPALVARFRRDIEAALGRAPEVEDRFALAVSGGPDSMAMLVLAHAAFPGQVIAASVDHRLRAESADEAAMVAGYCSDLGVAHATLVPDQPITGASVQAQARAARYALLGQWAAQAGANALLTAHHADDQAETFLMRAVRGSGISGLAAIREAREWLPGRLLLRPLLEWRRAELRHLACAAGASFVDDPSNASDAYDRTRFRALLEANPWLDVAGIARSAGHLAEAERALIASADMAWDDIAELAGDQVMLDPRNLPRELLRRLVRTAISRVRETAGITAPAWEAGANIEALLDALSARRGGTQAGVMAAALKGGRWHFAPAPPRRSL